MANVKIAGNIIVLTSTVTMNQLRQLEKHRPKALTILDEENTPVFRIGTGSNALTTHGASFNAATLDGRELAYITLTIPEGVTDGKRYFAEIYGNAHLQLKQIEGRLPNIIDEVDREICEIMNDVKFADYADNGMSDTSEYATDEEMNNQIEEE